MSKNICFSALRFYFGFGSKDPGALRHEEPWTFNIDTVSILYRYSIDTVPIQYRYCIHTVSICGTCATGCLARPRKTGSRGRDRRLRCRCCLATRPGGEISPPLASHSDCLPVLGHMGCWSSAHGRLAIWRERLRVGIGTASYARRAGIVPLGVGGFCNGE